MPRYSAEFKAQALELLERNGRNCQGTARQLGIGTTTLSRWAAGGEAEPTGRLRADDEIRRLQKALREAEMEREILKKAVAFFAKEKR